MLHMDLLSLAFRGKKLHVIGYQPNRLSSPSVFLVFFPSDLWFNCLLKAVKATCIFSARKKKFFPHETLGPLSVQPDNQVCFLWDVV